MNLRGTRAERIDANSLSLNVTSAQYHGVDRSAFSPMTPIQGGYKGYLNFEAYWQSGKVYEDIPHATTQTWWLNIKKAHRRYPGTKGKRVLCAQWPHTPPLGYIESRKQVYLPEYYNLIAKSDRLQHWREMLAAGKSITVYDFDGPRSASGEPMCALVTHDLLTAKLSDPTFPFGHGYIVAAALLGLSPEDYGQ